MKALEELIIAVEVVRIRMQKDFARWCEPAWTECYDDKQIKWAHTSALVIAFVCMSANWCFVDTYLKRQRQLVLANTSYSQSRFTRCVRCTCRSLVERPLKIILMVASLSSATMKSTGLQNSITAKKSPRDQTWKGLSPWAHRQLKSGNR